MKKKARQDLDPADVLKGRVSVTMVELIRLIHRINPTGEAISAKAMAERYKWKSELQSLLIKRFPENLVVEQPDPENPRLVGFRLRHFDEDACHAMIEELDSDARAWTQRQLDESRFAPFHGSTMTSPRTNISGPDIAPPTRDDPDEGSIDPGRGKSGGSTLRELMDSARMSQTEYDYDSCEEKYLQAMAIAGDDPTPAVSLLELYVDYLAAYEKALDLPDVLPVNVRTNDNVKVFLALAAARSGLIDPALEYIKRQTHARGSEVYLIACKHFSRMGDRERASLLLKELESFEQPELKSEVDQLAKQIRALQEKSLEPVEQEMSLALQQGKAEDALKLADRILSVLPENKPALRVVHEIRKRRRDENIQRFLRLADVAAGNGDFHLEADFLNKAIACGVSAEELANRLECARNKARRKKEESEIQNVLNLFSQESSRKAYLGYIDLTGQQRALISKVQDDRHLPWLDIILAKVTSPQPEKMIEAVLMMGKCHDALERKAGVERIAEDLEPHAKFLQFLPEMRDILHQVELLIKSARELEAKNLMDRASDFLEKGELLNARSCMNQVQEPFLGNEGKERYIRINLGLQYQETREALEKKYRLSLEQQDHFASRKIAGDLARHLDQHSAEEWLDKAELHNDQLTKEWSLTRVDIDGLPLYYASLGLNSISGEAPICLLPGNRHVAVVSSHKRWVFLRIFDLAGQSFKTAIILRTPIPLSLDTVCPVGNTLWMVGTRGDVLELGLDPWTILSWYDSAAYKKSGGVVEDARVFPKSKTLWLSMRDRESTAGDITEVFDLEKHHATRQVKASGFPWIINTGEDNRVAIHNLSTNAVSLYSERGKPMENFAFKYNQSVHSGTIHPNGKDFIFLPFAETAFNDDVHGDESPGNDELLLQITVKPDLQGIYKPIRIENSNGEQNHWIFTSLENGIVFVSFTLDTSGGFEWNLAAFKDGGGGLERIYQVPLPERNGFALDEFSKHVVAVTFSGDKVVAARLQESPPAFPSTPSKPHGRIFPDFRSNYFVCQHHPGSIGDRAQGFSTRLKNCSGKELEDLTREIKQAGIDFPEEMAAFIVALGRDHLLFEKADELRTWMRTHHPNHFTVLQEMAEKEAEGCRWKNAVSLLERISLEHLPEGSVRHICHLLGMGYFIAGEVEKALNIWVEGMKDTGGECNLNPFIEYARFALMPPAKRKKRNGRMAEALELYETVDSSLADGNWEEATNTLEKGCDPDSYNVQLLGRLAWGYLNKQCRPGEKLWVLKIAALGNFCEKYDEPFRFDKTVFPPFIETWPESRLSDVAKQAAQWLDQQIQYGGNGNEDREKSF